jgi:hypothetical protein
VRWMAWREYSEKNIQVELASSRLEINFPP